MTAKSDKDKVELAIAHFIGRCIGFCILYPLNCFLFQYSLSMWFGKDIPWYGDMAGGLFPFNLPIAIVTWIVSLCQVPVPFIQ